jgi:hypothetical protein
MEFDIVEWINPIDEKHVISPRVFEEGEEGKTR